MNKHFKDLGFRPGNVAATFVLVASTLFANSAMAIPTDYTFSGSNNIQSGEVAGTLNGFFTLNGAFGGTQTGSDVSFTIDHLGSAQTWDAVLPGFSLTDFLVETNGSGDVLSILFDADATAPNNFLFIEFDVTNLPDTRGNGSVSNQANYCGLTCQDRLFLDNVTVSKAAVPEPSIIALFALGLVGLGFARRRRQS
jgi:hypothetical protein